jgi:hypothetical protein
VTVVIPFALLSVGAQLGNTSSKSEHRRVKVVQQEISFFSERTPEVDSV